MSRASKTTDIRVLERIKTIFQRLNLGEKLSVKALALEFACCTKTIQRDINERIPRLCEHLGIKFEPTRDGKLIKLQNQTTFSSFSDNIMLLQNVDSHLFANMKVENILHRDDDIQTLESAIGSNLNIKFDYKSGGKIVNVLLVPVKIICFDGFWYLLGQDNKSGTIKKYYIKNISNIKISGKAKIKQANIDTKIQRAINVWFDANVNELEVRLYADKSIAEYFMRMPISKTQTIMAKDSDGGIELSVMITNDNEIVPVILKWMPNLLILSPVALKNKVEHIATSFLKKSSQI